MPEITTEIFANVIEPRKVREHSRCFATLSTSIENECFFSKAPDEAKLVIFGNENKQSSRLVQRANRQQHKSFIYAVFSLSFSSSGEGQCLTGKAKNALLRVWWGGWVRGK